MNPSEVRVNKGRIRHVPARTEVFVGAVHNPLLAPSHGEEVQRIREEWVARGAPIDDIGRLLLEIEELHRQRRASAAGRGPPFTTWGDVATILGVSANTVQTWRTAERRWGNGPRRRWLRPNFASVADVWDWYEALQHITRGRNSPKRPPGV